MERIMSKVRTLLMKTQTMICQWLESWRKLLSNIWLIKHWKRRGQSTPQSMLYLLIWNLGRKQRDS